MRLDEEIMYAKKEKEFNSEVNKLLEYLYSILDEDEILDESGINQAALGGNTDKQASVLAGRQRAQEIAMQRKGLTPTTADKSSIERNLNKRFENIQTNNQLMNMKKLGSSEPAGQQHMEKYRNELGAQRARELYNNTQSNIANSVGRVPQSKINAATAQYNSAMKESAIPIMKILKVTHSEPAELLRETDYSYAFKKMLDEGISDEEAYFMSKILETEVKNDTKTNSFHGISMLREFVGSNLEKINSNNLSVVMEGYTNLAGVYVLCESTRENKICNC